MFGTRKQISRLKEALEATQGKISDLERQNSSIRVVLESMVEGVIIVARDTQIISLNPSAQEIFGILKKESEGRLFLEAIRNNDIAEIIESVLRTGEFISKEITLVWPVQGVFHINAAPILENGIVNMCLVVLHDITEIKKLEKMRSDFVANVSHELKTPLTSIKGFVETLLTGALEDRENSQSFLKIIQDHTERLDNLINDLLKLSYLESKEIKLEIQEVNLKDLVNEVLSGFKSQLKKKVVEVKNDLTSQIIVRVDKGKLERVFTNLIDNAIKFNKEKGWIKIYKQDSDDKIRIIVEDSGMGIPPKDIPRIFERFYRVDKARSRELGGTGLGLSIVKHIIELHGGTFGVESTEGLGSKFWFLLPK